jgi:hypothetical protein
MSTIRPGNVLVLLALGIPTSARPAHAQDVNPFSGLQVERVYKGEFPGVTLRADGHSIEYAPPPAGQSADNAFLEIQSDQGGALGTECVLNKEVDKPGFSTFFGKMGAMGGWYDTVDVPDAKPPMLQLATKLGQRPLGQYTPQDLKELGRLAGTAWNKCEPGKPTV